MSVASRSSPFDPVSARALLWGAGATAAVAALTLALQSWIGGQTLASAAQSLWPTWFDRGIAAASAAAASWLLLRSWRASAVADAVPVPAAQRPLRLPLALRLLAICGVALLPLLLAIGLTAQRSIDALNQHARWVAADAVRLALERIDPSRSEPRGIALNRSLQRVIGPAAAALIVDNDGSVIERLGAGADALAQQRETIMRATLERSGGLLI
ncbi:MAG TPA: hypothetical protein VM491_22880, partial [Burkholderiaceae bacterium]|nr:hypothetical protein [Burkholderiaceae bacterium]